MNADALLAEITNAARRDGGHKYPGDSLQAWYRSRQADVEALNAGDRAMVLAAYWERIRTIGPNAWGFAS